MWVGIKWALWT